MKKFTLLSLAFTAVILITVSSMNSPQDASKKIKSFNSSINYETQNKLSEALNEMKNIYGDNKNDYLVNLRLGWLHYLSGDFGSSKKYYTSAVKINKNSIEAKLGLTLPLSYLGEWDAIKNLYWDIIKIDEYNYTANLRLGQIYLANAEYGNAKKFLEKAHKYFPGEYEANLSLGWTNYYLGDRQKAKELWVNAKMLSPDDSLATQGLQLIK